MVFSIILEVLKYAVPLYIMYLFGMIFVREVMLLLYYKLKGHKIDYYFPLLGVYFRIFRDGKQKGDAYAIFKDALREDPNKKYYLSNAGGRPFMMLFDQKMVADFYAKELQLYSKDKISMYSLSRSVRNGLIFSEGTMWKNHRRILSPAFHFDCLQRMLPIIQQTIKEHFAEMVNEKRLSDVHIMNEFQKITGDISLKTFFGADFSKKMVDGQPMTIVLTDLAEKILWQALRNPFSYIIGPKAVKYGLTAADRNVDRLLSLFRKTALETIDYRRTNIDKVYGADSARKDFLQVVFEHNKANPDNIMTDDDIVDQILTFFGAGMDTTGHLASATTYYMWKHPATMSAIKKEFELLGKPVQSLTLDDVNSLKYLDAFIKEVLRFAVPIAQLMLRVAKETHMLGDVEILKGTSVNVAYSAIAFNENEFVQPYEFRPERWLNEAELKKQHPFSFIPFSAGPHHCIGKYLATIEAKLILLNFIETFDYNMTNKDYQLKMTLRFLYEPLEHIKLDLTRKEVTSDLPSPSTAE